MVAMLVVWMAAGPAFATPPEFDRWLRDLRAEALVKGISGGTFDNAFAGVRPISRVVELDRQQPEFMQSFWQYLDNRVSGQRIDRGRTELYRHRQLLEQVRQRFGVEPRFLVAFWALESNFGTHTGNFPVIAAVATLAYDERRSAFFRSQLLALLELIERGDIRTSAKGSWAGAMGQPQFIATTYRDSAVDFDGDGRRDLWGSLADVLASAANYLSALGWQENRTWGREVRLPPRFDLSLSGLETSKSLAEWQRLGVRTIRGESLPQVDIEGSIILPAGIAGGPAFIVYDNFRVIMGWNRSILYAIAVGHLADRLAGEGPLVTPANSNERPLSRANIMEMQRLLGARGFHAGEVDGIVGPATREAIKEFQQVAQLPADGFPTIELLYRIRVYGNR